MLRVTIEAVPWGAETGAKVVATGRIVNDGTGSWESGNYRYLFEAEDRPALDGAVRGFPRLEEGPWDLLRLALEQTESGP